MRVRAPRPPPLQPLLAKKSVMSGLAIATLVKRSFKQSIRADAAKAVCGNFDIITTHHFVEFPPRRRYTTRPARAVRHACMQRGGQCPCLRDACNPRLCAATTASFLVFGTMSRKFLTSAMYPV